MFEVFWFPENKSSFLHVINVNTGDDLNGCLIESSSMNTKPDSGKFDPFRE